MSKRCSLIVVGVLCCMLVMFALPCQGGWSFKETALPAIDGYPSQPKVCGDWAVAARRVKTSNGYANVGIACYDLTQKQVYTIFEGTPSAPCISGNTIAFSGKIDSIPELRGTAGKRGTWPLCLVLFDLPTGALRAPILKTNSAFVDSISGSLVAYELGCRIYLYDMATGAQRRISDDQPLNRDPDIGGDLVVWKQYQDRTMKMSRVVGQRLSTGEMFACSDEYTAGTSQPHTDGATVVWSTAAGTTVFDAGKGFARLVPNAQYPDVSNGVVVYLKSTGCTCANGSSSSGRGVYGGETGTVGEFKIGTTSSDSPPAIENRRVVWAKLGVAYFADITKTSVAVVSPGPKPVCPRVGSGPTLK